MGESGRSGAAFLNGAGPISPLLEISNAIVHAYKSAFGRGPTHARTRFAGSDTLLVLLQDTMTVSERKLVALGKHERLREQRLLLHQAVEDEMCDVVERILHRRPLAVVTGIDTHRDVAAEVFLLSASTEPDPDV
jgi:uncharacterized protein YbcI